MCQKQIKLNAKEDVQEFVKAAGKCDFDIDVFYNRIIIDAKSILGVLSMDRTRVLTVPVSYTHLVTATHAIVISIPASCTPNPWKPPPTRRPFQPVPAPSEKRPTARVPNAPFKP